MLAIGMKALRTHAIIIQISSQPNRDRLMKVLVKTLSKIKIDPRATETILMPSTSEARVSPAMALNRLAEKLVLFGGEEKLGQQV